MSLHRFNLCGLRVDPELIERLLVNRLNGTPTILVGTHMSLLTLLARRLSFERIRAPHYTVSDVALCGSYEVTGELELAHQGILYLEEILEFKASALLSLVSWIRTLKIPDRLGREHQVETWVLGTVHRCACGMTGTGRKCYCSAELKREHLARTRTVVNTLEAITGQVDVIHCMTDLQGHEIRLCNSFDLQSTDLPLSLSC